MKKATHQSSVNNIRSLWLLATILLATLIVSVLSSCTKCAECTRTYTLETYTQHPDGSRSGESFSNDYSVEQFDICGSSDIKNAERPVVQRFEQPIGNGDIVVSIITGNCNCTTR